MQKPIVFCTVVTWLSEFQICEHCRRAEKLTLVTELWDDLVSNPEDIPITSEQIAEVER
ncbi:MAG: addiction module protein [Verrucomicrobia bacterium]|nr:addiction module protein [Verrucomicrobiota bacterium]